MGDEGGDRAGGFAEAGESKLDGAVCIKDERVERFVVEIAGLPDRGAVVWDAQRVLAFSGEHEDGVAGPVGPPLPGFDDLLQAFVFAEEPEGREHVGVVGQAQVCLGDRLLGLGDRSDRERQCGDPGCGVTLAQDGCGVLGVDEGGSRFGDCEAFAARVDAVAINIGVGQEVPFEGVPIGKRAVEGVGQEAKDVLLLVEGQLCPALVVVVEVVELV